MTFLSKLGTNFNYVISTLLFVIGLYTIITKPNLIKKFMGLNIMETSVFLAIVSIGAVRDGKAPIVESATKVQYVNPLPQALILTGIVVAVSTTALALSLMIKLYEQCGTLNADKLREFE